MDSSEIRDVFGRQKERLTIAIAELKELRQLLGSEHQGRIDITMRNLEVSLADDEDSFNRLQQSLDNPRS